MESIHGKKIILNFRNKHMKTMSHRHHILIEENGENHPNRIEKQETVVIDQFEIDQAIKLLNDFDKTQEPNFFKVVG